MNLRQLSALLAITLGFGLTADSVSLAADAPDAKANKQLVRLVSTSADGFGGFGGGGGFGGFGRGERDRDAWVVVAPLEGGKPKRLTVPEAYRRRVDGVSNSRGQLAWVTVEVKQEKGVTTELLTEIVKYDGDQAIGEPGVYQYDSVAQVTAPRPGTTLKLSRAGMPREFTIAMKPASAGGATHPDPLVMAKLNGIKPGTLVEVEVSSTKPPTVVDVNAYAAPTVGEFVKLVPGKTAAAPASAIVVIVAGEQKSYLLPAPATGPGANTGASAKAAAMQALAKKLKPGNGVGLSLKEVPAETSPGGGTSPGAPAPALAPAAPVLAVPSPEPGGAPATPPIVAPPAGAPAAPVAPPATVPATAVPAGTLRDLRYAGKVELAGEHALDITSSYVRVNIEEGRGRSQGTLDVDYHGQDPVEARTNLFRGVDRILESVDDAVKLGIVFEQADAMNNALKPTRNLQPSGPEQTTWINAYKAWMAAKDEETRRRLENDMLAAAQDLSLRVRQVYVSAETAAKSVLKKEQAAGLQKLGEERRDRGFGPGRGFGGGAPRMDVPGAPKP